MFKVILVLATIVSVNAHGLQLDEGDNKAIYMVNGSQVDALTAFKAAMADQKVLQCGEVEAIGNKRTGKVALKKKR